MKRQLPSFVIVIFLAALTTGCTRQEPPLIRGITPWRDQAGFSGRAFETAHYRILTTCDDDQAVSNLGLMMERALPFYVDLTGVPHRGGRSLPIYYFATYDQWADYTRTATGPTADVYLRVFSGGYTLGERVVCWQTTSNDLLATAVHEGMHQFVARNFARRLPPVIEEGLAVACEDIDAGALTIGHRPTPRRLAALQAAVEGDYLIPLDTFLMLHAGDVSDRPDAIREAFYAQCWAVITFLRTSPKYQGGFLRMLADSAAGTASINIGPNRPDAPYNAGLTKPLLEHYLATDWATFIADFNAWTRQAVRS